MIEIIWSKKKNRLNIHKHRVDFDEAQTIFEDSLHATMDDPDHSLDEQRFITIGTSEQNRLLIVVHTLDDDRIRIISARKPTRRERLDYEEGI